jgi:3-methylfumaryl-CoA hydratase
MAEPAIDLDHLRGWIGRTETARDVVSQHLATALHATLDLPGEAPLPGEPAALAIHWCLTPRIVASFMLGPDGHPPRGDFLPPVPLPRRMSAGSAVRFLDRLRVGDAVERRSRIADVSMKSGRSGTLCFVAVDHEFHTERGLALRERHDIVYRPMPRAGIAPAPEPVSLPPLSADIAHQDHRASPPLLFRYSALTFNGHRIHYDWPYVTQVEGYPGLIVHGPLQATLLLEFAAARRGTPPRRFSFRGLNPLFDFMPFRLRAEPASGGMTLWVETGTGRTMEATAEWHADEEGM